MMTNLFEHGDAGQPAPPPLVDPAIPLIENMMQNLFDHGDAGFQSPLQHQQSPPLPQEQLIVVSAKTVASLRTMTARLGRYLAENSAQLRLKDVSAANNTRLMRSTKRALPLGGLAICETGRCVMLATPCTHRSPSR